MAVSQSLIVTQQSQDVTANKSQIRILWQSIQTGVSFNDYTHTAYYWVSVNGGAETRYSVTYSLPKGKTATIVDVTINIAHKADGTGSVKVRTWMDTRISAGEVELNKNLTLDTIPRATTPTLSATVVDMGGKLTINLPRASSNFTHSLAYSFAGEDYVRFALDVGTSYTWTVPDLASKIPKTTSGTMTIRVITKNGDDSIGTKTVSLTVRVPASVVPTISKVVVTEATTGLAAQFGAFVQNKSRLAVAITAAGAKGSTIKSYSTKLLSDVYGGASFTTEVLQLGGNLNLYVTVTDTRERTTTQAVAINGVLEYHLPQITKLRAYRVDANGAAADDGTRLAVELAYNVASLNSKNTAYLVLEYKRRADTEWSQLATFGNLSLDSTAVYNGPFSIDYQYDVRATITDWFGATDSYLAAPVLSAEVIIDISADGLGLAIGGTSQLSGLESYWRFIPTGGFFPIKLPANAHLDAVTKINNYYGTAYSGYQSCPAADRDFALEVLSAGPSGQLMQRLTTLVPLSPVTWVRFYTGSPRTWSAWMIVGFESIWQAATLSSGFALYSTTTGSVQYKRSGSTVEVKGIVKPTKTITNADGWVTICTLPEGYRPGGLHEVNHLCQGAGAALWLCRITTSGAVQFGRYQLGGNYVDADTSARLPFHITFLTNEY